MEKQSPSDNSPRGSASIPPTVRGIVRFVALFALMMAALLLSAGTWQWLEAWILLGFGILNMIMIGLALSPELRRERASTHANVKPWDRWVSLLVIVICPLLVYIIAGLDKRLGLSPELGWVVKGAGILAILVGYGLSDWAMLSNPFFSANVRIQSERGQHVVQNGPYQWLRHPGYSGSLLAALGIPFLLGSLWAIIPTGIWIGVILLRTALEDDTLFKELDGYGEYTSTVRHRIFPGLW